jgi:hypothetical protein
VLDALQRQLDVHLREAGEDVFAGGLRALQAERGVLVHDAPYGLEDFLFLATRLRPDRERRRRLGELDRLEGYRFFGLAEGIEGRRVAEFGNGDDVACDGFGDGVALLADEV